MSPRHHPFRILSKLLDQNDLRPMGKILQDYAQRLFTEVDALAHSRAAKVAARIPERCEVGSCTLTATHRP
jgi:hypothetical protein